MKFQKAKTTKNHIKDKGRCHEKLDLAIKELKNLTKEAKDFFVLVDSKEKKDARNK